MKQEECTPEYQKCLACEKSDHDEIFGLDPDRISCPPNGIDIRFKVPGGEIIKITRWKKKDSEDKEKQ